MNVVDVDSEELYQSIKVSEELINYLAKDLLCASRDLVVAYDENSEGLGRHKEMIEQLLEFLSMNHSLDDKKMKLLLRRLKIQRKLLEMHIEY